MRDDDSGAWFRDRFSWRAYNTALEQPAVVQDINGDGVGDIIGFTDPDLVVAVWQLNQGDEGQWQILLGGKAEVDGDDALDIVSCGDDIFTLTGTPDAATLTRLRLQTDGATRRPVVAGSIDTAGTMLACGPIDSGEAGVVGPTRADSVLLRIRTRCPEHGSVGATGEIASRMSRAMAPARSSGVTWRVFGRRGRPRRRRSG